MHLYANFEAADDLTSGAGGNQNFYEYGTGTGHGSIHRMWYRHELRSATRCFVRPVRRHDQHGARSERRGLLLFGDGARHSACLRRRLRLCAAVKPRGGSGEHDYHLCRLLVGLFDVHGVDAAAGEERGHPLPDGQRPAQHGRAG